MSGSLNQSHDSTPERSMVMVAYEPAGVALWVWGGMMGVMGEAVARPAKAATPTRAISGVFMVDSLCLSVDKKNALDRG